MGTISYFEEDFPLAGSDGKSENNMTASRVEIITSSFSGEHEIYLKHKDNKGHESKMVLNKELANRLLEGLESAVSYLQYDK